MITSLLNTYYFISTTITTINQSYYIKHILFIISTIIMILRLGFTHFVDLKIRRKPVDYTSQCQVLDATPHTNPSLLGSSCQLTCGCAPKKAPYTSSSCVSLNPNAK